MVVPFGSFSPCYLTLFLVVKFTLSDGSLFSSCSIQDLSFLIVFSFLPFTILVLVKVSLPYASHRFEYVKRGFAYIFWHDCFHAGLCLYSPAGRWVAR